jgi:phosphoribosylglycinamide formyltransferase
MIHEVIAEVDAGEAVVVAEVELRRDKKEAGGGNVNREGEEGGNEGEYTETLEELETRMHEVEHGLIVEGTRKVLERIAAEREQAQG